MRKLQSQGVHHLPVVGADRQTSIDFGEGVLGMPFVFEQPNLDNRAESHLYFDPGDGRLITVFTNEERAADPERTPTDPGCVHHLAFSLSQATFAQAVERLDERGIRHSGVKDRGFMDSIYFTDPVGTAKPSCRAAASSTTGRASPGRRSNRTSRISLTRSGTRISPSSAAAASSSAKNGLPAAAATIASSVPAPSGRPVARSAMRVSAIFDRGRR